MDATVIEISAELAARFKSYGARFLQVGKATPNVDVVILQFPAGHFSIADGDIEAVTGDKVFYQIGTEGGSSGSPLFNLDCVALAMHNAGSCAATSSQPAAIRKATALSAVIKAYLANDLKSRRKLLMWRRERLLCIALSLVQFTILQVRMSIGRYLFLVINMVRCNSHYLNCTY